MSRSSLGAFVGHFAPLVLTSLFVAGCGSGSNGVADTGGGSGGGVTAENPVTVTTTYDFSAPLNYFVVGTPPIHARFLGGVAADNGAWIVKKDQTATINFGTPADKVTFTVKDNYTPTASAGTGASKTSAGGAQKMDDPFAVDMYLRGQIDGDWAVVPANKFVPTSTDNVALLTKTITAGTYEFKVADAGWSDGRNCGGPGGPGTVVVGTPFTMNCANAAGNNLTVTIATDGDYDITFDARGADKLAPTVTFAVHSSGGGGGGEPPPPEDSAEIRIYSKDMANPDAAETVKTVKGTGTQAVEEVRAGGDARIVRIEIENLGTAGDVGIEDFTWTSNPKFSPAGQPVDIYYRRASGGYASTNVSVDGKAYACAATTSDAYGCVVTGVPLYPYQMVNLSVTNGSSAAETIVTNADTATQPIYAFSGVPEAQLGSPGETGKPAAVPRNANEILVFYKRSDDDYTGWGIHLFPKDPAGPDWTTWAAPYAYEGIDPAYGAYFRISLPQDASPAYSNSPPSMSTFPAVLGFIIHKGDTKDPGPDQEVRIAQDGNMVFVVSGVTDVGSSPQYNDIVKPTNYAAHWVLKDTVLWKPDAGITSIDLLYSPDASLTNNVQGGFDGNYATVHLTTGTNPQIPYLKDLSTYPAFSLPSTAVSNAQAIARSQIYIVGKNANGAVQSVTRAQINGALDDLYYEAAKDVILGPSYSGGVPSLKVWAPTAVMDPGVSVQLYNADGSAFGDPVAMTLDPATGVWSATGDSSWDRKFYTYTLKVYSQYGDTMLTNTVSDPYAVSGNTDGSHSQVVNLDDADLMPAGWNTLAKPAVEAPEDIVVYELHVRDFSIDDTTVPAADRGKFTAFDAPASNGRNHLESLAAAGLTHVHILPAFDIASVIEDPAQRVDIQDTVQKLCDAVPDAAVYCYNPANGSKTIKQLLTEIAAADPTSLEPQAIVGYMSGIDGFNWGYDPYHYGSPEGSYSTDPNGAQRVLDFRRMVKGLADAGLHTVMDVVYNHTASSGMNDKSVFDRVVPGYYHRRDLTTGAVQNKQCCNDMASEWKMYEKLMFDTSLRWVRDYKVDGFRFDIMAAHTKEQMQRLLAAAQAIQPEFYIYGEGWNTGGGQNDTRYVSARQDNLGGTGIGSFNDRIRDAIRGGGCCDSGANLAVNQGITSGLWYDPNSANSGAAAEKTSLLNAADKLRSQLAGGIKTYSFQNAGGTIVAGSTLGSYAEDPSEIINYNENHDNETFWDISQYKHPAGTPASDRVRAYNVGMSMVLLSEGVPFFEAGQEMLRSKSTDKNSYNSGDWFNELDWTMATWNWGIGLPPQQDNASNRPQAAAVLGDPTTYTTQTDRQFAYDVTKEWLQVRKSSQLFRLRTADQIKGRMTMINTGPTQQAGVVAYKIDGCASSELTQQPYGAVVTVFNPTTNWAQVAAIPGETYVLHPVLAASVDALVKTATYDGTNGFRVPPRTTAVYVRNAQTSCSPYGVPIFVRGLGGDWTANPARELAYTGGTTYARTIAVVAGAQQFKIADNDWTASSNCGATADGINVQVGKPLLLVCSNDSKNVNFAPASAGDYAFTLDALNKVNPMLTVGTPAPFGSTTMYVRGGFNDWGNGPSPTAPMAWDNLSTYRAEILNIAVGTYDFKVADAGWSDPTNCGKGGSAPASVTLGTPYPLTCGAGTGNISLPLAATGSYLFSVDGSNPAALQVTVEKMPFTAALYVRGLANDWSSASSNRMSYLGAGIYAYSKVLAAGADDFKIADDGWTSGTDCGSSSALGIGAAITLACTSPGNGNINFTAPAAGLYEFRMDATNPTAPALTATGP